MGEKIIRNLGSNNIYRDNGEIQKKEINEVESNLSIVFPSMYSEFICKHNVARLEADTFSYSDPNTNGKNSDSIAFENVEKIPESIELLKLNEVPDWDENYKFEDGLIPFGENGVGDMICFDYRKDKKTDNPPIVIWNHDMGLEHRVVFVAKNFEEFVDMLYEPKD